MYTGPAVRTAVTAVTLLVLGAGALRAQRTTDTTLSVRANARLNVTNQNGTITVRVWNRSQIRVVAESDHDRARVEINETASGVSVRTSPRGGHGEVDFTISVPAKTQLELHGMSSDIEVVNVCGEVSVNTMNGDVNVDCAEGSVQLQSISGDITLGNVRGSVEVGSTSGDVDVRGVRGGPVSAQSVSGDVSLAQVESNDITAETVSGEVDYEGRLIDGGRYKFASHSGDVTLRISGTPSAAFQVETFSGDFESDYTIELTPGSRVSGKKWEFRLGTGSSRVQLGSFSGTVSLRRMGAGNPREE
jgi:DUF4097 and DUF4098 domain-containing protein YvlB